MTFLRFIVVISPLECQGFKKRQIDINLIVIIDEKDKYLHI